MSFLPSGPNACVGMGVRAGVGVWLRVHACGWIDMSECGGCGCVCVPQQLPVSRPHVGTALMPRAMHSGLNPFSPSRVQSTYLMSFLPSGPNACVGMGGWVGVGVWLRVRACVWVDGNVSEYGDVV